MIKKGFQLVILMSLFIFLINSVSAVCQITASAEINPAVVQWQGSYSASGKLEFSDDCIKPYYTQFAADSGRGLAGFDFYSDEEEWTNMNTFSKSLSITRPYGDGGGEHRIGIMGSDLCGFYNQAEVSACLSYIDQWTERDRCEGWTLNDNRIDEDGKRVNGRNKEIDKITNSFSYSNYLLPDPSLISYPLQNLEVVPDPDYIKKTKEERKFRPTLPFTPFDDFIIQGRSCANTDVDVFGFSSGIYFPVSIITKDSSGKEVVIKTGVLTENPDEKGLYQWKVSGWPDGITDNEKMEILIDSIANGREVKVVYNRPEIVLDTGDNDFTMPAQKIEVPIQMSNCVQVYGEGDYKLAFTRVNYENPSKKFKTTQDLSILINNQINANLLIDSSTKGFTSLFKAEPFKKYSYKFSIYADLINNKDLFINMPRPSFTEAPNIEKYSACGLSKLVQFSNTDTSNEQAMSSGYYGVLIPIGYMLKEQEFTDTEGHVISNRLGYPTIVHELGHNIGGLLDEYPPYNNFLEENVQVGLSNCERVSNAKKVWGDYADIHEGCYHFSNVVRASSNSIMFNSVIGKFNVISCGYLIANIIGGEPKSYWPECMTLDTIKPDCTKNSCPSDFTCKEDKLCHKNS